MVVKVNKQFETLLTFHNCSKMQGWKLHSVIAKALTGAPLQPSASVGQLPKILLFFI